MVCEEMHALRLLWWCGSSPSWTVRPWGAALVLCSPVRSAVCHAILGRLSAIEACVHYVLVCTALLGRQKCLSDMCSDGVANCQTVQVNGVPANLRLLSFGLDK